MPIIPFKSGDMVWTSFPFEQQPDSPGPVRHAACVIAAFKPREAAIATSAHISPCGLIVGV
jgi:hypothetical protein